MPRLYPFLVILLLAAGTAGAATITVNTTLDVIAADGLCTLREAIINANNNDQSGSADCVAGSSGGFPPTFNFIVFDPALAGATITLNGTPLPTVTKTLFVTGPVTDSPAGLTLHGNNASRIFYAEGEPPSAFTLRLRGLTLTGGRTTGDLLDGLGGAVAALGADIQLLHVRVADNGTSGFAAFGGGVGVVAGRTLVVDSLISDNFTSGVGASGGGIFAEGTPGGPANEVIRSTLSGNTTTGLGAAGGGLHSFNHLLLVDSTVAGNSTTGNDFMGDAAWGGGIYTGAQADDVLIVNSTVSGNSTTGTGAGGGGIAFHSGHGRTLLILHSTVAFNQAADGVDGVIAENMPTTPEIDFLLENSVIVQSQVGEVACSRTADSSANSLATDTSCSGAATAPVAIGLQPLADNGGPTRTHAVEPSSGLVDAAGDCNADHGVFADQRGVSRPFGTACDIGAFEYTPDRLFNDRFE